MTPNQFGWTALGLRKTLRHGERPTDLHVKIAFLLARWQNPTPSHKQLARAAGCHPNTVRNALDRFRTLGLLSWVRQVVVLRGGWRAWGANRYLFNAPCAASPKPAIPRKRGKKESNFDCPTNFVERGETAGQRGGIDLLAARRARFARGEIDLLAARRAQFERGEVRKA